MFDFIGKKYYFFVLSALIIIAGITAYLINGGFNLDIQFQGGTVIEIQVNDNKTDIKKAEEFITSVINKKVTVQNSTILNTTEVGKDINLLIINIASKDTLTGEEQNKVIEVLKKELKLIDSPQMTVRNIHPSIGKELLNKGLNAVVWASILIVIYIWIRFNVMSGLSAGIMAIIALLHDVLIMFSVYTIFNIPLNESFIAAILTIIGYSMNDTIIIYDRIRENSNQLRRIPVAELVNKSVSQTLARSINTVVTVLICLITVYIYASYNNISSIKEFSLPLIVGISSGCYSSIFIAGPLWVMWKERELKRKLGKRPLKA